MTGTVPFDGGPPEGGPSDHFLVCGGGTTARMVVEELSLTGRRFTVVESDHQACEAMREILPAEAIVEGDATDEEVLERAGVRRSTALVATLLEDKMNLVVIVTALQMNPDLRVISRGTDEAWWDRLRRTGAIVVSPAHIGGRRLATGILHPDTTVFLNEMLAAPTDRPIRFEAVVVTERSEGAGRTLGELDLFRRTGLAVVALCRGASGPFSYNPGNDTRLAPGDRLVVVGDWHAVDRLAGIVGRWE